MQLVSFLCPLALHKWKHSFSPLPHILPIVSKHVHEACTSIAFWDVTDILYWKLTSFLGLMPSYAFAIGNVRMYLRIGPKTGTNRRFSKTRPDAWTKAKRRTCPGKPGRMGNLISHDKSWVTLPMSISGFRQCTHTLKFTCLIRWRTIHDIWLRQKGTVKCNFHIIAYSKKVAVQGGPKSCNTP